MRCVGCDRPMRRHGQKAIDAPGTVAPASSGKCTTCYQRDRKQEGIAVREPQRVDCNRCGCPSKKGLCRDCRYVLSKEETAIWA